MGKQHRDDGGIIAPRCAGDEQSSNDRRIIDLGKSAKWRIPAIPTALVLAEAVLFLHLLWCAWVSFDWTLTRRRPVLRTLHIASLIYAIVIESVPWPPCPLTVAESWLEARAGVEPARGPFLVHILDAIVYPNLPVWLVAGCAVFVCVAILCVYLWRYRHRTANGRW
ncbi:MAG: DUF2784 domain-containing protein [Candidatus Acidiferrales bacterium]